MHALNLRILQASALALVLVTATAMAAQPAPAASRRVALVPLDDRPPNLQWPILLGEVADTEVITPARGVLGRFLKTADGDAISRWLDSLDLSSLTAVVVSSDMLAYGGLAGSRVPRVFEADARRRLDALARLKQRRPDLPVYAFSTMLRAPAPADDAETREAARTRNQAVNLSLVARAAGGEIDYLVFSQDGAPQDGASADRDAIVAAIAEAGITSRAGVHAGPDQVAMLLLARAMAARVGYRPVVQPIYSSPTARQAASMLTAQAEMAGASVAERGGLQVFVYASRQESPDLADGFAARISQAVASGNRVVVADLDTTGTSAGAWLPLIEAMRTRKILPRLFSYASSTSAEHTVGTALAHGVVYAVAVDTVAARSVAAGHRVATAQVKMLLHRLIYDFLYEGVIRRQVIEDFVRPRSLNPSRLDDSGRPRVERHLTSELKPLAESLAADFTAQPWRLPGATRRPTRVGLTVKDIDGFEVTLPWGRMAEAEIRFGVVAQPLASTPRPPGPRVLQ